MTEQEIIEYEKRRPKPKRWLRKRQVGERYGDVDDRTVDRMKLDGRIPPPTYFGRIPMWAEDELDASDRQATRTRPAAPQPAA
jgi:hypothetical protein